MRDLASISQLLVQFSPDALLVVDGNGVIRYANATAASVFNYGETELLGKHMETLIPERFHIRHGAHVVNYLRSPVNREMAARVQDLFARRADGTEFPAGIRLAPFESGGETYIALAVRDMTERREINDALSEAREEAERANRAKSRFLATASHDLRQPMQTVRMLNASMLKLVDSQPDLQDLLVRQEQAINGATRLLNSLLDISRLESGAIEPNLASVPMNELFEELRQEFQGVATAKGLSIEFPVSGIVLSTDRVLLAQLLQNLIGNSLKYTERGFVRIRLFPGSDDLMLVVEDSGVGIPEQKLDRIFEEYYQVGPEGTRRLGVGLGLAIVREVARILGYSVSVLSSIGRGTEVRVRIPAGRVLSTTAPEQTDPAPQSPGPPGTRHSRIVLLEDNDAVRRATELFLTLEGHEVQSAASVADAEPLLRSMARGDVLITDYHLGQGITGLGVLEQLRIKNDWCIPAIVLSGDLQSMMRGVKSPPPNTRFLSKPVDARALTQAIDELSANS